MEFVIQLWFRLEAFWKLPQNMKRASEIKVLVKGNNYLLLTYYFFLTVEGISGSYAISFSKIWLYLNLYRIQINGWNVLWRGAIFGNIAEGIDEFYIRTGALWSL
jgi:hypothetical protein